MTAPTDFNAGTALTGRKRWAALAFLALGVSMIILDATVVNVAIPTMVQDLGLTTSDAEWVSAAYSLTFASLLILALSCLPGVAYAQPGPARPQAARAPVFLQSCTITPFASAPLFAVKAPAITEASAGGSRKHHDGFRRALSRSGHHGAHSTVDFSGPRCLSLWSRAHRSVERREGRRSEVHPGKLPQRARRVRARSRKRLAVPSDPRQKFGLRELLGGFGEHAFRHRQARTWKRWAA